MEAGFTNIDQNHVYRTLRRVVGEGDGLIVVHSALYALRIPGESLKWPLLGALRRLVREGHTLALPTFTFGFCRGEPFHHLKSQGQSGQLGEWFLELSEVRRTAHPIYSFAVAGPRAGDIIDCKSSTTFGSNSPFGLFDRANARLVMLGCPWSACTQFHFYEEEASVPYRYYKDFRGEADVGQGARTTAARMFVRDLDIAADNDFAVAVQRLREDGAISEAELGGGIIEATSCKDLGAISRELLNADPYVFVKQPWRVRYEAESKRKRQSAPPLRVALVGTANLAFLEAELKKQLQFLVPDQSVELYSPPFGQSQREVIDKTSALHTFQPEFIVFADRLEDIWRVDSLYDEATDAAAALDNHLAMIESCAEQFQARLIVNRFANLQPSPLGAAEAAQKGAPAAALASANARLDETLGALPSCHAFDLAAAAQRSGAGDPHDARLWHIGRFPFSQSFTSELARRYASLVLAATGRTVRLLALDLDDTLWGGVLGEDGLEGLQLGGDHPGNAYAAFQRALKRLAERGIALAVVSKNDETDARKAMAQLPGMVIREQDLAAWRINWRDKAENLQEIARELDLGLEHIGFIDDNPAERARMSLTLPEIKVIDIGDDPARYAEKLLSSPFLECLELTEEDRGRAKRYAARRLARQDETRFARVEDFYAHLRPRLHIEPLSPGNAARAAQLAMKTNQFNTTLVRFSRAELEERARNGGGVYVLGLEDRYTERENIGLLVMDWETDKSSAAEIVLFLLSCRVLGRGVESAALSWAAEAARTRGAAELRGRIVEGPRNAPVRDLYSAHGFKKAGQDDCWRLALSASAVRLPEWIELNASEKATVDAA